MKTVFKFKMKMVFIFCGQICPLEVNDMTTKSKYNTKQRAELTAYLMSKSGEHVTVNDVCRHFEEKGRPIGVTTVYRQLDKMVAEGLVNKYNLDSKSSACYEYIDSEHHMDGACSCYHCNVRSAES